MKIYIVTEGSYSDYHIEAVFTDREQAKLYCASHNDFCVDYEIEEWEAVEIKLDSSLEICERWHGIFDFEGHFVNCYNCGLSLKKPIKLDSHTWRRVEYHVTVYVPEGTDKDKVQKIMCDVFAQWKYETMEGQNV